MPSIFVNMASTVPGTITVKNWSSGQLGISLQNEVSDETLKGFGGNDALNAGLGDDASQKTPHLIAAYACHTRATARFDCQNKHRKVQKQQFQRCMKRSNAKTSYAHSARLAGHKGLGRRMDSAWIIEERA